MVSTRNRYSRGGHIAAIRRDEDIDASTAAPEQPPPIVMASSKSATTPPKKKKKVRLSKGTAITIVTPSPKKKTRKAKSKATSTTESTATTAPLVLLTRKVVSLMNPEEPFIDSKVPPQELRPSTTLTTGQCFHWRVVVVDDETTSTTSAWGSCNATEWVGVIPIPTQGKNTLHAVVVIRETPTTTLYRILYAPPNTDNEEIGAVLREYFQLDSQPSLTELYQHWSNACPRLARIAQCIPGVRVVQQDPFECLVSFLCSSNNNIPRITQMLASIRREYGTPLLTIPSNNDESEDMVFYSFPSLKTLRERATEDDLRSKCGMGYRAKYLMQTMDILHGLGGETFLKELRSAQDPRIVQEALCQFHGVGRKVADCVALFSLNQCEAIPVDVHVWNVAMRDYGLEELKQSKSLTPTVYKQVGDLFQSRFKEKAGWAHSLLFVAELPSFRPLLPLDLVEEMDKFRQAEQAKKEALRQAKKRKKQDN